MALKRDASGKLSRLNPDTGKWEPVDDSGKPSTVVVTEVPQPALSGQANGEAQAVGEIEDGIFTELEAALNGSEKPSGWEPPVSLAADRPLTEAEQADVQAAFVEGMAAGEDLAIDVPGLVSGDGVRGVSGQRRLKDRLAHRKVGGESGSGSRLKDRVAAKRGAGKRVEGVTVEVSGRAAQVVGDPSGTADRQREQALAGGRGRAAQAEAEMAGVRRVKPGEIPLYLSGKPKWMQDLFLAHFYSADTLALRKVQTGVSADGSATNRMKISKLDFTIGWMIAMEKIREDPSIARLGKSES